jgi:outer membrane cobalamin receptor
VLSFTNILSQNDSLHKNYTADSSLAFEIPMFNSGGDESESGQEQQDVSGLLRASRDIFTQFSSFQFGSARFRVRGLNATHHQVLINGIDMGDAETGIATWSSWGGLNDITRFAETRTGFTPSRYGAPGAGGYTYMDTRASSHRKGTRVSYASSSRLYRHRLLFSHSSGLNRRGWAFTLGAVFHSLYRLTKKLAIARF